MICAGISESRHPPNRRVGAGAPSLIWPLRERRPFSPEITGRRADLARDSLVGPHNTAARVVVWSRPDPPAALRFFPQEQAPTLRAFCDIVLSDLGRAVPVAEAIEAALAEGRAIIRYHHARDDRDTWRTVLAGLNYTARAAYRSSFARAGAEHRERIVTDFAAGSLSGGPWETVSVPRPWAVAIGNVFSAFLAHPQVRNGFRYRTASYPRGFICP